MKNTKILKWENKKGSFWKKDNEYEDIDKINFENIKILIEKIYNEEIIIDKINNENQNVENIKNSPNFIIYNHIYKNFDLINKNKKEIFDEIENEIKKFKNAL